MQKYLKKVGRNFNDYGLRITLNKCMSGIVEVFYEDRKYCIYMKNLEDMQLPQLEEDSFDYRLIDAGDENCIQQIEEMEEWLQGKVRSKLENGSLCLVAMDGQTVAGFNIVALKEGNLPLVHFTKKLRKNEAWSTQISVRKSYRGKKLASSLRKKIFILLRDRGIRKLYGGANVTNIPSLKLARKIGFTELVDYRYRKVFNKVSFECKRVRS